MHFSWLHMHNPKSLYPHTLLCGELSGYENFKFQILLLSCTLFFFQIFKKIRFRGLVGYGICLTRRTSPVRSWAKSNFLFSIRRHLRSLCTRSMDIHSSLFKRAFASTLEGNGLSLTSVKVMVNSNSPPFQANSPSPHFHSPSSSRISLFPTHKIQQTCTQMDLHPH